MGTVPTGRLERELRRLYAAFVRSLPSASADPLVMQAYIESFRERSLALIKSLGGDISRLGVALDFPAPRELELDLMAGRYYDDMKVAAVRAQISLGINSRQAARQMLRAGMDSAFYRLERLARTETVRAYWKNQWDSVAELPAVVMVWGAERGPRTCDYCLSRDGLVVEDQSIRDHPNGRCTLVPTLRDDVVYKGTLQADGSVTHDPKWRRRDRTPPDPLAAMSAGAESG